MAFFVSLSLANKRIADARTTEIQRDRFCRLLRYDLTCLSSVSLPPGLLLIEIPYFTWRPTWSSNWMPHIGRQFKPFHKFSQFIYLRLG